MPNIAQVIKEEIQRLARKQVKAGIAPLRRENIRLRKHVADLRRQVAQLTRASQQLLTHSAASPPPAAASADSTDAAPRLRPTSKSLNSLRHRLGLTQVQFAQLLGVSPQAVVYWAARRGPVKMRRSTLAALADVQRIGKREARKRLEAMGEPAAERKRPARKRAHGKGGVRGVGSARGARGTRRARGGRRVRGTRAGGAGVSSSGTADA